MITTITITITIVVVELLADGFVVTVVSVVPPKTGFKTPPMAPPSSPAAVENCDICLGVIKTRSSMLRVFLLYEWNLFLS